MFKNSDKTISSLFDGLRSTKNVEANHRMLLEEYHFECKCLGRDKPCLIFNNNFNGVN
ncbi:unnamed protein product [Moneuplotes crassus]|uniref:Uncharacterized protein n=1 Tax=Euplotes crassus TaxID=5936 RepID=A0AAD1XHG3_EUPCR|nr:unnamed protein product [Moneuplotes crassus]